ncbi:mechanosensitive ion channel [Campylobacter sp. 9BO]|uniref:mechanosensitive ion channel domain-containing protein n=1 Tax=Campylobacter sp. 9BO TaxID=3424759 RepID=UPI003D357090
MRILFCLSLFLVLAFGEINASIDVNSSFYSPENSAKISELQKQIDAIDLALKNNIWITRYANYRTYEKIKVELEKSEAQYKKIDKNSRKAEELDKKINTLNEQINLLKEFEKMPFSQMLASPDINLPPRISNPIALVGGFSYMKKVATDKEEYAKHIRELDTIIEKLKNKEDLLSDLIALTNDINSSLVDESMLEDLTRQIAEFKGTKQIADTTFSVYEKRAEEAINITKNEVKSQVISLATIAILILAIIGLSFFFKFVAKRTISDDDRFYTVNKFINFINFLLIILILLFAYIENVTYIVTVLGFASAGLAIAMKDMFMSMLGWVVITVGGTFHVGDRIKVQKGDIAYVGDIIDISLLRMTVFEDVTMASYLEKSRRAGRIVFVPNHYIFTELISNYAHYGMKTVWDGLDIFVSFDSNHKKAVYIAKTIARKYSKGYTDIAKRQMGKLRAQYSIKNSNVDPRVFTLFEPYGICISIWYMANSYAPLALRSTISAELIDAFSKEDDIRIAYPTQTLYTARKISPNIHSEIDEGLNE